MVAAVWTLRVRDRVRLVRDLPGVRVETEAIIRRVSANTNGVCYAVRFNDRIRVVAERDLSASGGPQ
jgi:hypothetical protein